MPERRFGLIFLRDCDLSFSENHNTQNNENVNRQRLHHHDLTKPIKTNKYMKTPSILFPIISCLSSLAFAQTSQPPHTWHRSRAGYSAKIFNGTRVFMANGEQRDALFGPSGSTSGVSGQGSANRTDSTGSLQQTGKSALVGRHFYGSLGISGEAELSNNGQILVSPQPGLVSAYFLTERGEASAFMDVGYQDVIEVTSTTLPPGATVTIRMSLSSRITGERIKVAPVLVTYPPTGPGFSSTTGHELRTVTTDAGIISNNNAGYVVFDASGKYLRGGTFDGRVTGDLTGNFDAVIGGTVHISHSAGASIGAATEAGDYNMKVTKSFSSDLSLRVITPGATLRSKSGHRYGAASTDPITPPADVTAPILTISGKIPKSTKKKSMIIKGTASDESGIQSVQYRIGNSPIQTTTGTTAWSLSAKLKKGKNTITIFATDKAGKTSADTVIKIKRK